MDICIKLEVRTVYHCMVLGLMLYLWGQKRFLGEIGLHPVAVSSDPNDASNKPLTREEKEKIAVIFILAFFAVFFWAAFEQAGSSLTLFADQATDRRIPFTNWIFPASYFQAVNPLFIIMCNSCKGIWLDASELRVLTEVLGLGKK